MHPPHRLNSQIFFHLFDNKVKVRLDRPKVAATADGSLFNKKGFQQTYCTSCVSASDGSSDASSGCVRTDQCLVVYLLPDEFILAEGVTGLSGDGVYWSLFHLLLHGTVQHEEGLTSTLLRTQRRWSKEGRERWRCKTRGGDMRTEV